MAVWLILELRGQGKPPGVPVTQFLSAKAVDSAIYSTLLSSLLPRNLAGKLLNEPGLPERQCIVIRVEQEEDMGHASAVLLDTKLDCFWIFWGLEAWPFELAISRSQCSSIGIIRIRLGGVCSNFS